MGRIGTKGERNGAVEQQTAEERVIALLRPSAWQLVFMSSRFCYASGKEIAKHHDFVGFGLTDTAIAMLAPGTYLVMTDDRPLYGLLQKRKVDVINFNHIRQAAWLQD